MRISMRMRIGMREFSDWATNYRGVLKGIGVPAPYPIHRRLVPGSLLSQGVIDLSTGSILGEGTPVRVVTISGSGVDNSPLGGRLKALGSLSSKSGDCNRIVIDAFQVTHPLELAHVHEQLQKLVLSMKPNGRIVIVSKHPDQCSTTAAVASYALKGFVKSLAKELGAAGTTVNLIHSIDQELCEGSIAFLLSDRSAFITGQCIQSTSRFYTKSNSSDSYIAGRHVLLTGGALWCGRNLLRFRYFQQSGAAQGIGEVTAHLLAAGGAKLLIVDHPQNEQRIRVLASKLRCEYLLADVTSEEAASQIVAASLSCMDGHLDSIIHNAGIIADKTFQRMVLMKFMQVLQVNLCSVMRINEALLVGDSPILSRDSRIVCVSSISGIAGAFGQTNYAASKAGIIGYVNYMSKKLENRGIAINAVAPGFIVTRMTKEIPFLSRVIASRANALMQPGFPEDVAEALVFLSSRLSAGVNGQTIRVCGGNLLGE